VTIRLDTAEAPHELAQMARPPILLSLFLMMPALALNAQILKGRVFQVSDGDTILIQTTGRRVEIRLHGIDAPELMQVHGMRAKRFLARLVNGREVRVLMKARDRLRRIIGVVTIEEINVNMAMIAKGMAWVYRRHIEREPYYEFWKRLERRARIAKRGLWSDPHPVAPWRWRRMRRRGR